MRYPVGTRVKLMTMLWGDNKDNPVWNGNNGQTEGTIIESDNSSNLPCYVHWDNNKQNRYYYDNLEVIKPLADLPDELFVV